MFVSLLRRLVVLCVVTIAFADPSSRQAADGHWIDTWASMPQLTEPANLPPPPYNGSNVVFQNSTVRQTVRITLGAEQIRIAVSNAFGTTDLPITAMTVALPFNGSAGQSAIRTETLKAVTFGGKPSYIIPNGALALSDPIAFKVEPQSMLSITTYLANGQQSNSITSHPGSRTTSWFTQGNQVEAANLTGSRASAAHWYFVSAVQGWVSKDAGTLSIIGDSITDGRGSTTDANDRWPDRLLARLQQSPSTSNIAVANQAAGGNRVLHDGLGPNALSRIDRDVLSHSGTRYVVIFEGVNDIGTAGADAQSQTVVYDRLIAAYSQIITRVHTFGIPVFGATITPFSLPGMASSSSQPYSDATREATRQKVNQWIRGSGEFDAVVDFDAAVRDPQRQETLNRIYDSGDYLHLNVAGYERMAQQFPIEVFEQFRDGVTGFE